MRSKVFAVVAALLIAGMVDAHPSAKPHHCFETKIHRNFVSNLTTPPILDTTDVSSGNITTVKWANVRRVYTRLTDDDPGFLIEQAGDIMSWEWDRPTALVSMEFEIAYQLANTQNTEALRFNVGTGTCPNVNLFVGGDVWHYQFGTVRDANVGRIFTVNEGQCFGLVVAVDQATANSPLTMHSVVATIREVSTEENPCQ